MDNWTKQRLKSAYKDIEFESVTQKEFDNIKDMQILNEWGNSSYEEWYTVIKESTKNYKITVEGHNEEIGLTFGDKSSYCFKEYKCYINKEAIANVRQLRIL